MFQRKIYSKLLAWKQESAGKTALLIEGARRVGKSTLAEEFAKREYKSYILIDFSVASKEVRALFEDISDLDYIFLRLQLIFGTDLHERKSVIIFDEIQLCPLARQAIKYLVKDGRYDYLETGSLISIKKNVKDILIPSEERRVSMYPMDFEEFLWAIGNKATPKLLAEIAAKKMPLGDAAQILTAKGHALYYHTFLNEKTRHNYEIDFLMQQQNKLCPIEVKSSGYSVHKSLDKFAEKYSERIAAKYLIYTKDLKKMKMS